MSTSHLCPTCGAPRDLREPTCRSCSEPAELKASEERDRQGAELASRGSFLVRVWSRVVVDQVAQLETIEGRRTRQRTVLVLITLSGLALTAWLTATAEPDMRVTVALLFGALSFGLGVLAQIFLAPAEPWLGVDPARVRCVSCGCWQYAARLASGRCTDCHSTDESRSAVERARALASDAADESAPRPLGCCPRCGGEAAFEDDAAACRHCAAPLHPGDGLRSSLTRALQDQRRRRDEVRSLQSQRLRGWAGSAEAYMSLIGLVLGVAVAVAIALSIVL